MNERQSFIAIEVEPDVLRSVWSDMDLGLKARAGTVAAEVQPRYLNRPLTQIVKFRLANGWVVGIAHRWRASALEEWSLPDPKRIWLHEVALYCR